MDLDQKIKKSLDLKSEWHGSTTQMWADISSELQTKRPWWKKQQLWFSTFAAAAVILILFLQTNKPISPPSTVADPESAHHQISDGLPKVASFSTMIVEEPLAVEPNEKIHLSLSHWPALESDEPDKITFSILHIEEITGSESLIEEIIVNEEDLDLKNDFVVIAPEKSGTYRLVIEGNLEIDETIHTIHASKLIEVSTEKGR